MKNLGVLAVIMLFFCHSTLWGNQYTGLKGIYKRLGCAKPERKNRIQDIKEWLEQLKENPPLTQK